MRYALAIFLAGVISLLLTEQGRGEMVYLHQKGEKRQVALASDQGELIRLLTPEDLQAYHPEISADGRYVAYSIGTIRPELVDVAIHVLDLETGEVEIWTPSGNQYIHAEFSGNGEYLAYSGPVRQEDGEIRQLIHLIHLPRARARAPVRVETKNGQIFKFYEPETEVINSADHAYFPALASDASFVVYHRTRDVSSKESIKELVRYNRFTKEETLLTEKGGHAMVPSLSWDNRYLAYAGIRDNQWDIHVIDLWQEEDRRLTRSAAREFTPVFAPDGSISYTHISNGDHLRLDLYRIPGAQVFAEEAAVQPEPFVAEPEVAEYIPAFSGMTDISLQLLPDLPAPARSSFGTVAHGGKIYVAGGHQGPEHTYPRESFLDRLDIYDPGTQKWTQGAPLSVPRHGFELVAHKGYLYAFGGFAYSERHQPAWHSLDIIERYDIAADRWEILPGKLPRPRSSNIAAQIQNEVYLIGGWDSTPKHPGDKEGQFHRQIDVFNLRTLEASATSHEIPDPLRRAFTAVVHNEEIILLGGISQGAAHFNLIDNVTVFAPRTGQWREMAPLPFATFAPGVGVYNNRLFLFGGMNTKRQYQNTIYTLALSQACCWRNTGRYLKENKGFPLVVEHPRGGLGILGGHTYLYTPDGKVDTPVATFEYLR